MEAHLDEAVILRRWQRFLVELGRLPPTGGEAFRSVRRMPGLYQRLWTRAAGHRCGIDAFARGAQWLGALESGGPPMLILSGSSGSWKSTAAAWLAAHAGVSSAWWVRASELGDASRDRWLWSAMAADFVVLDDLGLEYLDEKGWMAGVLDDAINRRYEAGSPTVVTTNLAPAVLKERYHGPEKEPGRMYRRLRDMTRGRVTTVRHPGDLGERCHAGFGPDPMSLLRATPPARPMMPELVRRLELKLIQGGAA